MNISEELKGKINLLFKNNEVVRKKLLLGDADTIREIGMLSQKGINPVDVVDAYESNSGDTMKYLYNKAKKIVELQKLYRELCLEYYKQSKGEGEER